MKMKREEMMGVRIMEMEENKKKIHSKVGVNTKAKVAGKGEKQDKTAKFQVKIE